MVRMAEMTASKAPGDVLVALGLGSCIGLALVDDSAGAAALAHVVLPDSHESRGAAAAAKFADTAVPALVREAVAVGARRNRLQAILVGGAQMFSVGPKVSNTMDIGLRNAAAVRRALDAERIPVLAEVVGGSVGRTIRVYVGTGSVTCKEAGGAEAEITATQLRRAA